MRTLLDMVMADPIALTQWPSIEERTGHGWMVRVVYRNGQHQIEHVRLQPNIEVLPHRHPHIDTFEVYIEGTFLLMIDDHQFAIGPHLRPSRRIVAIRHDQYNGGLIGADGAQFLSIQQWIGSPTSTAVDWEGPMEKVRTL